MWSLSHQVQRRGRYPSHCQKWKMCSPLLKKIPAELRGGQAFVPVKGPHIQGLTLNLICKEASVILVGILFIFYGCCL